MFDIYTDSASNLTADLADTPGIKIIPYTCRLDGGEFVCYDENRPFEDTAREFYAKMREGAAVSTTLINAGRLAEAFEQSLRDGRDVLFIGMSSGLTGTIQSARSAAATLADKYPGMLVKVCDSFSASLGEGLLVLQAAKLKQNGASLEDTLTWLEQNKMSMSQVFTVDDLKYLRKGGRISGISALVGSLLHIKPVLRATNEGTIGFFSKTLGRRRSLDALVEQFSLRALDGPQTIGIAHGDCEADARYVAERVLALRPGSEVIMRYYDLCTGAHVGPGTVALFFFSTGRE